MLFRKVKVSHTDDKNSLYRVMYVPEDINLDDFAKIIMRTFRAVEGHLYEFEKSRDYYIRPDFTDDLYDALDITRYTLQDPGTTYKFIYDFGDWWEFEVRIYKKTMEMDTDCRAIVTEGRGAGIWEDNRMDYLELLGGVFPADLREDDEDNGYYMPWNLNLEKAADTFKEIDPEAETEYLNGAWFSRHHTDESIWGEFNRLNSIAENSYLSGDSDGSEWLDAYAEFKRVCEQLKEDGKLPDTFAKLCYEDGGFGGPGLPEGLTDALTECERYEDLLKIMDELEDMFGPDGSTEDEIIYGKSEALKALGRGTELLNYLNEACSRYPENYFLKGRLLNTYMLYKKKKDGTKFMNEVLAAEPECTLVNSPFYTAAAEFAEYAGMKTLAGKLKDQVKREENLRMEEIRRKLESPDENDDLYDDVITEELEDLDRAVAVYSSTGSNDDLSAAMLKLAELIRQDGYIFMPAIAPDENGDNDNILTMTDSEGNVFLPLFTDPSAEVPHGYELTVIPVRKILNDYLIFPVTGVAFVCKESSKYRMMLRSEQISSLLDLFKTFGLFE